MGAGHSDGHFLFGLAYRKVERLSELLAGKDPLALVVDLYVDVFADMRPGAGRPDGEVDAVYELVYRLGLDFLPGADRLYMSIVH